MTEEERQKIILELEQEVLGYKPWNTKLNKRTKKKGKCEVCGGKLINGDCPEHPVHIRMHHNYLQRVSRQYQ
tara:strand:- start:660 stop:875 length:216 start_codon:yes stop_codon:yes gene_type:complete